MCPGITNLRGCSCRSGLLGVLEVLGPVCQGQQTALLPLPGCGMVPVLCCVWRKSEGQRSSLVQRPDPQWQDEDIEGRFRYSFSKRL